MTEQDIVKSAYEINAAYCRALGDNSFPPFDHAADWQKQATAKGVEVHLANPDMTPEASHISWLKEKADQGWGYGPIKDPERKQHPCFVEYENLPVEQKAKDYLFKQVIESLRPFLEPKSEWYPCPPPAHAEDTPKTLVTSPSI